MDGAWKMPASKTVVTRSNVLAVLCDIERRSQQGPMSVKRQFVRQSLRGEAILQTLEDAAVEVRTLRVQLRDISLAGIGFLTNEPVEVGTIWRVMFVVGNYTVGQQTITVRHGRAIAEGAYICGGQFCMEPGVLQMIGVDPDTLRSSDSSHLSEGEEFLPPDDSL